MSNKKIGINPNMDLAPKDPNKFRTEAPDNILQDLTNKLRVLRSTSYGAAIDCAIRGRRDTIELTNLGNQIKVCRTQNGVNSQVFQKKYKPDVSRLSKEILMELSIPFDFKQD